MRLIMIDPKMLELSVYQDIPHLLAPVVTDMKQAANALTWCVAEMDRRYKLMNWLGVRNLSGFNHKIAEAEKQGRQLENPFTLESAEPRAARAELPHIVRRDRRARRPHDGGRQEGRGADRAPRAEGARRGHPPDPRHAAAVGRRDHRPHQGEHSDAHRVPGLVARSIRAPSSTSRAPKRCSAQGDMLYLPPGAGMPQRVHGAFVADHEVHKVVEHLKSLAQPEYLEDVLEPAPDGDGMAQDIAGWKPAGEKDPLYDQAVEIVLQHAPAVDLAGAAPPADRLQPRRAPDRGHGARGHGLSDAVQRQPRGAGPRESGVTSPHAARVSPCSWRALSRTAGTPTPSSASGRFLTTPSRRAPISSRRSTAARASSLQESKGSFVFQRPGRFRWIYEKPVDQLIVGDGERVWIHDRDLNQVTVRRISKALGSTPAALLAGASDVEKAFELSEAGTRDRLEWLEAKPRDTEAGFDRIRMGFARPGRRRWSSSTISARPRALRFSTCSATPRSIPPSFRFEPPKGADVLGEKSADERPVRRAATRRRRSPRRCGRSRSTKSSGSSICSGPGKPLRLAFESRQAALDDPLGTAGLGQDHPRAADGEGLRRRVRRALGGVLRREGHPRGGAGRRGRARALRPPHHPLRRRGAPLQQGAAGRLPAVRRARPHHFRRRDHREPFVRGQQRAAFARRGLRSGALGAEDLGPADERSGSRGRRGSEERA